MWDVPTINHFLELSKESRFGDLYHFAILTGLRRSEICGLKWQHVDLVKGRLSVVTTLQRIKGLGLVEGHPKTHRSRRPVALSPEATRLLRSIKGVQIGWQLQAGPVWQDLGYVFTEPDGSPVIPDKVTQNFARIIKRLHLPHLTLQGLRHAFASLLLSSGVNLKVTSEMLGHSNIAVTGDIYSHVLPGLQEEAVLALDRKLAQGQ
jgi:integrase